MEYPMNNATNVFVMRKMFEKQKNKENPNASTFAKNSLFITKFHLPGMLRWSEVVEEIADIETSPIQNTLSMLQDKNLELDLSLIKLRTDPNVQNILSLIQEKNYDLNQALGKLKIDQRSLGMQTIGQKLKGIVVPEVGGGVPKIEEAFINDEYLEAHPDDKKYHDSIIHEIKRQVHIIQQLLPIHDKLKADVMQPLQDVLEEEFAKMKEAVSEKYKGLDFVEGFRVSQETNNVYFINFAASLGERPH